MCDERRKSRRVDLDIDFAVFSLELERTCVFLGKVENVSAEGMLLTLEDDIGAEKLVTGCRVICERFPEALEVFGEDVSAVVAWSGKGQVGLRFLAPLGLTDEDISEVVSQSGLPGWIDWPEEP